MSEDHPSRPPGLPANFRQLTGTGFFLLAVLFVTGDVAGISRPLADLVVLCLMLGFLLVYLPLRQQEAAGGPEPEETDSTDSPARTGNYLPGIYLALLFAASSVLVLTQNRTAALLGLAVLVFGMDVVWRKAGAARRELVPLLLTLTLYALFLLLIEYIPQLWLFLNRAELVLSSGVGRITGSKINLAATYSGAHIVVLFALYFTSVFVLSRRRNPYRFIGLLLSVLVLDALYLLFWGMIFSSSLPKRLELAQPFISINDFRLFLFVLLLVPTFFLLRSLQLEEVPLKPDGKGWRRVALALVFLLAAVAFLAVQPARPGEKNEVVFYDTGYLDWRLPDFSRFGLRDIGMFGHLPKYLEKRGYPTRTEDELTGGVLDDAGTLVLTNLDHTLDAKTKDAVWEFVRGGGSLLVLGDHTGQDVIRKPYNDILRRVGIAYNFDSTIPTGDRWRGGLELRPHPMLHGIEEDEVQINVGASLSTRGSSRPVIIGKYGYSDKGNALAAKTGYLGDMKYSRDERLGDMVLAAESYYGDGKVLAFGDTTSFQNGVLMHSYEFVDNVFAWLSASGSGGLYPYNILITLLLLAASLVLMFLTGRSTISLIVFIAAFALGLLVSSAFSGLEIGDHGRLEGRSALIDVSHLERVNLKPFSDDSIDGLGVNLIRNGYVPLLMKQFSPERIKEAELLVVVAPAREFSPSEIKTVKDFVARGGLLVLTCGSEEFAGSQSLASAFRCSVGDTPLGLVRPRDPNGVTLWKAWPVLYDESSPTRVLARAWDYPVIVYRPVGSGGVIVAGDSSFLLNRNLEQLDSSNRGNIDFLKECLGSFEEGRTGK